MNKPLTTESLTLFLCGAGLHWIPNLMWKMYWVKNLILRNLIQGIIIHATYHIYLCSKVWSTVSLGHSATQHHLQQYFLSMMTRCHSKNQSDSSTHLIKWARALRKRCQYGSPVQFHNCQRAHNKLALAEWSLIQNIRVPWKFCRISRAAGSLVF